MDELVQMKERSKAVWALGDYPEVARRLEGVAGDLVAACAVREGQDVLDVAAGNGNVAIAAARAGGQVTASDFTPELVVAGRERSDAERLDIAWDVADAEDLPYADGCFDVVLSVFGLMFAPRPEVAIAEAFRVLRPDGVVGLCAWTPDGYSGRVSATVGRHLPAPAGVPRPVDWGDEAIVRERLAPHAPIVGCARGTVVWEFASPADGERWQQECFGVLVAAREALRADQYAHLLTDLRDLAALWNTATDGSVRIEAEYLRVVARR
jgi:SAM-dependent methyltransferase